MNDLEALQAELEQEEPEPVHLLNPSEASMDQWMAENWDEKKWNRLLPPWRRWLRNLSRVPKQIKWSWQRARRGYSDQDTWSFDDYLAGVILGGLSAIRSRGPLSHPMGTSEDRWEKTLDEMIEGFEMIKNRESLDAIDPLMWDALECFVDNFFDLWD